MNNHLTWEDVLQCNNIVGGKIVIFEEDWIYHGSIDAIKTEEDGQLSVYPSKTKRTLSTEDKKPSKDSIRKVFKLNKNNLPTLNHDGRISFVISSLSFGFIYPKGLELKLDNMRRLNL